MYYKTKNKFTNNYNLHNIHINIYIKKNIIY